MQLFHEQYLINNWTQLFSRSSDVKNIRSWSLHKLFKLLDVWEWSEWKEYRWRSCSMMIFYWSIFNKYNDNEEYRWNFSNHPYRYGLWTYRGSFVIQVRCLRKIAKNLDCLCTIAIKLYFVTYHVRHHHVPVFSPFRFNQNDQRGWTFLIEL